MKTWLEDKNGPIHPKEVEFINAKDLISVAKSDKPVLRRLFEQRILAPTKGLYGLFLQNPDDSSHPPSSTTTVQGDDEYIDRLAKVAIFVTALVMLIVPLWVLAVLDHIFKKVAVITAFTLALLLVLVLGTLAGPFETLTVTAGYDHSWSMEVHRLTFRTRYCAVLVVFLQLGAAASP